MPLENADAHRCQSQFTERPRAILLSVRLLAEWRNQLENIRQQEKQKKITTSTVFFHTCIRIQVQFVCLIPS
jgi:hypothetical protein